MADFTSIDKAMALVPKFPAFLSLCSSIYIVQHVSRSKKHRKIVYHRLLCGMSISDIIGSFGLILSTWPMPKGEAYLAAGNVNTCIAAGFFNQTFTLCTPIYNVSLTVYYVLVIIHGWKERRIKNIEKYLHAFPFVLALGTGIAGVPLKLYNEAGHVCWIASGLPNHPENHNPSFDAYRLAFMYAIIWAVILFLAVAMGVIYYQVLQQDKKMEKYVRNSVQKRARSREVRNQAFLYVGGMYFIWIFGSILRMMQFAGKEPPPAINLTFIFFIPLQGFFNLVIYKYPKRKQFLKKIKITCSSWRGCCGKMLERTKIRKRAQTDLSDGNETAEEVVLLDQDPDAFVEDTLEHLLTDNHDDGEYYENGAMDELANIVES